MDFFNARNDIGWIMLMPNVTEYKYIFNQSQIPEHPLYF